MEKLALLADSAEKSEAWVEAGFTRSREQARVPRGGRTERKLNYDLLFAVRHGMGFWRCRSLAAENDVMFFSDLEGDPFVGSKDFAIYVWICAFKRWRRVDLRE